ncbi:MAG: hypothetical protein AABW67_04300 [Nanoarchaeota archaeon]
MLGKESIYLVFCTHCKRPQQTIVRSKIIMGKPKIRTCFYCHKNFTLTHKNIIKKIA